MRKYLYVCRDCNFIDAHGGDNDVDKCPYCGGDDWTTYTLEGHNDDELQTRDSFSQSETANAVR